MLLSSDDSMAVPRALVGTFVPLPSDEFTPIVFIVDHDPSVRESLETLIGCVGLRPVTFASAKDCLGFVALCNHAIGDKEVSNQHRKTPGKCLARV